jgi:hypothetical protein
MDTNTPLETQSRRVQLPGFAAAFAAALQLSISSPEQVLDRAIGRRSRENDQDRPKNVS